jgi:transposase-like protein
MNTPSRLKPAILRLFGQRGSVSAVALELGCSLGTVSYFVRQAGWQRAWVRPNRRTWEDVLAAVPQGPKRRGQPNLTQPS